MLDDDYDREQEEIGDWQNYPRQFAFDLIFAEAFHPSHGPLPLRMTMRIIAVWARRLWSDEVSSGKIEREDFG
jgi:hypothetical protein